MLAHCPQFVQTALLICLPTISWLHWPAAANYGRFRSGAGQTEPAGLSMSRISPQGSRRSQGGRWPMPRARRIVLSSVITVVASSLATVFAQDEAGNRAPAARRPAANGPGRAAQPAPDPALMQKLLLDWERQSQRLKTLQVWI